VEFINTIKGWQCCLMNSGWSKFFQYIVDLLMFSKIKKTNGIFMEDLKTFRDFDFLLI